MRIVKSIGSVSTSLNPFHIDKSLKQRDTLSSLKLNFGVEYVAVMRGKVKEEGMELNTRLQLLLKASRRSWIASTVFMQKDRNKQLLRERGRTADALWDGWLNSECSV
jgi:hypothetical protein